MTVVLDTSVWVSALEFGGIPDTALTCALTTDELAISDFVENEVLRVLTRKFGREERAMRRRLDELLIRARRVHIGHTLRGICRDPNDDAVLETAVAAGADLLVSGDKDLLSLKAFRGIEILTPAEYLSRALSSGGLSTQSTNAS